MRLKLLFLAFILSHTKILIAQSTSTLMGARTMGMGFSSSTIADEWSLFNNIGGLGKINQPSANFGYEIKPALVGANRFAAAVLVPAKVTTLGLGVFRFGDDIYSESIVSMGLGNSIGNTSLGIKANYIQYRAEGFGTSTSVSFDFGGISQLTSQISVGAYITNLTQAKLTETDHQRLPTKLVAGLGFRPSDKVFLITEIEKDLDYQPTWHSGLEYAVYRKVFFRTGFSMNPNAGYFGLGSQRKNIKADYGMALSPLTGIAYQASAVYLFSSAAKK